LADDPRTPAETLYTDRLATTNAAWRRVNRRWSVIANVRLAVVILIGFILWQWWQERDTTLLVLAGAVTVALIALVVVHGRLRARREALRRRMSVNERALARLAQRWDDLPLPPDAGITRDHPYAWDLNIVGRASIAQRIGTPVTRYGWRALYRTLLETGSTDGLTARQDAVAELAQAVDLQQAVEASGLRDDEALPDPEGLVTWAASQPWLRPRWWLRVVSWASPAALVILFALWATDVVDRPWYLFPIAINAVVLLLWGQQAARQVVAIVPLRDAIAEYRDIFRVITHAQPRSEVLREIDTTLGSSADGAMTRTGQLATIVSLAIPPGAMIYFPLQLAFLWDVHILELLEAWQRHAGTRVRSWLEAAGEWEALAALSLLRRDHPGWAFPQVDATAPSFAAAALAHPLLPEREAVANDACVGPVGHLLFVTGSNMSGKSTLLRAIGANAVLAQAGAPVFARALTMPPVTVWTCMRVEDSLERGVSFFMAELQRLKRVVDGVSDDASRTALYLLDEILQGTNTGERQIASRRVLAQLARQRAFGAISSHDLDLIDGTSLERVAEPVHFAEVFSRDADQPSMTFDYTLRPGKATSRNALALMELLGFDMGDEPASM
jgi:hypothetical protein